MIYRIGMFSFLIFFVMTLYYIIGSIFPAVTMTYPLLEDSNYKTYVQNNSLSRFDTLFYKIKERGKMDKKKFDKLKQDFKRYKNNESVSSFQKALFYGIIALGLGIGLLIFRKDT